MNAAKWRYCGSMLTVFFMFGAVAVLAQEAGTDCDAGYKNFLANRNGPSLDKYKLALTVGNDYIAKCGSLEGREETKNYVAKQIPKINESLRVAELTDRFNTGIIGKKWEDVFASGRELIAANHPASLDILIVFAGIGSSSVMADPPVDKYNKETIANASLVIQRLNAGAVSDTYGVHQFRYKTNACPDGKSNTISWMNYTIGYIMNKRQKLVKESIPYLVKASQAGCELKDYPEIYRMIGSWYVDEALKLNATRDQKIKTAGDRETDETRSDLALIKGYTDRAIDAYARAFHFARNRTDMPQQYRDAQYKMIQDLFDSRYDGKHDGIDSYIGGLNAKPFPDPQSAVAPVLEAPAPVAVPASLVKTPVKRP